MIVQVTHEALDAYREGLRPIDRFFAPSAPRPNMLFQMHPITASEVDGQDTPEVIELKGRLTKWLMADGYWRLATKNERGESGKFRAWHEKEPYTGDV